MPKATLLRKSRGDMLHYAVSLISLFLVAVVLVFAAGLRRASIAKAHMEDGLVAAVLAAAVPDTYALADTGELYITDTAGAFTRYRASLTSNFGLSSALVSQGNEFITGRVELLRFTVYNVQGERVTILPIDPASGVPGAAAEGTLGSITTPNGAQVANTTIYAEIGFTVKGPAIQWRGETSKSSQDVTLAQAVDISQTT